MSYRETKMFCIYLKAVCLNFHNLHDPKMRGQACWSIGKLLSIIGHLAFTVNLREEVAWDDSTSVSTKFRDNLHNIWRMWFYVFKRLCMIKILLWKLSRNFVDTFTSDRQRAASSPHWVSDISILWYAQQLVRSGYRVQIGIYAIVEVCIWSIIRSQQ